MPVRPHPNRPKRFRARYRIRNWPQYEAGLKRRGDLTLWLDQAAIAGRHASLRTTPGGQARYSNLAIELVLILRLVFRLGLRQAEGFASSVLRLLGLDLPVPDHTTLSRRGRTFANRRPQVVPHGPLHLLLDSTASSSSRRASGITRSTAEPAGPGVSCIWPLMPKRARSSRVC